MSIQAMKQVVKEAVYHRGGYWIIPEKEFECIRQAIAEAEKQEPFGVMCINCGSSWSDERLAEEKEKNSDLIACCPERKMVNVYTHPQPKREWVGLTDEERKQLWDEWENGHVVEATEAKLKDKNGF